MKNFLKFIQQTVETVKEEAGKALENAQDVTANLQKQLEEAQKNQQNEQQANAENEGGLGGMLKGFLGSLENFNNENNNQNNTATNQSPQVVEEPITEIGHTFVVKAKDGDKTFHIAAHAELLAVENAGYKVTKYFLTTNKDQYVLHQVMFHHAVQGVVKTVVAKSQIANWAVSSSKELADYVSLYTIEFGLKSKVTTQVQYENEDAKSYQSDRFSVYTNNKEQINEIQSTILGKDASGEQRNSFVFVAGNGEVIKTSEDIWFIDGSLVYYFETLENTPKTHRLLCVERNTMSRTVIATHIPVEVVGDYTQIKTSFTSLTIPLKQSVYKTTYKDVEKPQTEEIQRQVNILGSNINTDNIDYFLIVLGRELPEEFWTEVYEPIMANYRDFDTRVAENMANKQANISYSSSSNSNSTQNKSNDKKDDKDENKNNSSSSKTKAKNIAIKVKNDTDEEMNVYNAGSGGNYRLQKNIITTIKMDEGDKLLEYNNQKKGRVLLVAEPSMDGKVQLISKL